MTLVAPSVSTSFRFLTTAFDSASSFAPSDSRPETNAGMPVGMAEIAIAVPSSTTSVNDSPRAMPTMTMISTAVHAMIPSTLVSVSSSRWSGDRVRVTEVSIVAIWPIWVPMPVAVTTMVAVPRVTAVFWNSMLARSPTGVSASRTGAASFETGALSPVRAASWVSRVAERRMRPSAGTMSPDSSWTMSPGTTSVDGIRSDPAVSDHPRLRHLEVREGVDARPRLQLLPGPQHEVEQDQEADDDGGRHLADHQAHHDDRDEHDVHRLAQLDERDLPDRRGLLGGDRVRAVLPEPRRDLGVPEPRGGVGPEPGRDVRPVQGVRGWPVAADRRCGRGLVDPHRRLLRRVHPATVGRG